MPAPHPLRGRVSENGTTLGQNHRGMNQRTPRTGSRRLRPVVLKQEDPLGEVKVLAALLAAQSGHSHEQAVYALLEEEGEIRRQARSSYSRASDRAQIAGHRVPDHVCRRRPAVRGSEHRRGRHVGRPPGADPGAAPEFGEQRLRVCAARVTCSTPWRGSPACSTRRPPRASTFEAALVMPRVVSLPGRPDPQGGHCLYARTRPLYVCATSARFAAAS